MPSLPERLVDAIAADIAAGRYPVGAKLPAEPALCEHYGVSRTVLREAMARMKSDGLIDTQQGRGSFVLAPSVRTPFRFEAPSAQSTQSILELAELRLGVEGMAAALAATRRTPEQLARLKHCLDDMARALAEGSSGSEADLEFHRTIADATGNGHYRLFMDYLRRFYAVAIDVARSRSAEADGLSQQAQAEHRAVYQAIVDGDAAAAEQAIQRHIRAAAARLAAAQATAPAAPAAASSSSQRRKASTSLSRARDSGITK
ncbi:FCD domain-containing protein [Xylophilus rhododendri]|uniref:FCD domain-containing protein n=2 Tax=Xylophilus rhododendri TaxID=2697032 RepID=A0A857J533_9BURK|nr:FCD domain-containing protein [Xylophilus rhododendri]